MTQHLAEMCECPSKTPDRVYPVVKNQEYDRVYDWEDRAGRSDHVGAAAAAVVGGREGGDCAGDLRAGHVGVAGGTPAWDCAEPAVHLAAAVRQRRAVGGGGRRGSGGGLRVSRFAASGS